MRSGDTYRGARRNEQKAALHKLREGRRDYLSLGDQSPVSAPLRPTLRTVPLRRLHHNRMGS